VLKSPAFGVAVVDSCGVAPTGCAVAGGGADVAKDIITSAAAQLLEGGLLMEGGLLTPPWPIGGSNMVRPCSSLLVRFGPDDLAPKRDAHGQLPIELLLL
jgi:hypothetical protein